MLLADITNDLPVPATEEFITTELLEISESENHPLHLCAGLLVHEIRNIKEKMNDFQTAQFLISIIMDHLEYGRTLTGEDLLQTFPYRNNQFNIDTGLVFANAEQFLCVRTLVDNSLAHGGCEVKYNPLENAFEIIDLAGVDWKAGYWEEIKKAYETGKNWENGQRFTNANRGKSIVATIMGIRGYPIPTEVRYGGKKGIKLAF